MERPRINMRVYFVGFIYRILRSMIFNIGMVALGFFMGYQFYANKEYLKFTHDEDARCIERIHLILDKHIQLNEDMQKEFSKLKMQIKK